jgi:hypothetical protein
MDNDVDICRGAYRTVSYVLAHSFTIIPFFAFLSFFFPTVSWFLVGMPYNVSL